MTAPRLVGAVLAVSLRGVVAYDTVRRAWWRGPRLVRVVLRHQGARYVRSVGRLPEGHKLAGLCVLRLGARATLDVGTRVRVNAGGEARDGVLREPLRPRDAHAVAQLDGGACGRWRRRDVEVRA